MIGRIPKSACLTLRTCRFASEIESAGLDESLQLAVALMSERALGEESRWAAYLDSMPGLVELPLTWSKAEVKRLLQGTEIYEVRDTQYMCCACICARHPSPCEAAISNRSIMFQDWPRPEFQFSFV